VPPWLTRDETAFDRLYY